MFTGDYEDYLPHPTWGGNGGGPTGWAYAGSAMENSTRFPAGGKCKVESHNWSGTTAMPAYAAGRSLKTLQRDLEGQRESFRHSQLGDYLGNNQQVLMCPKDAATSTGSKSFAQRPIKITSYTWNGQIIFFHNVFNKDPSILLSARSSFHFFYTGRCKLSLLRWLWHWCYDRLWLRAEWLP